MGGKSSIKYKADKIACYGLLLFIVLYYSQGVILPRAVGSVVLILIWGISLIYLIKLSFLRYKWPSILKVWLLFLILIVSYFIFYNQFNRTESFDIAKTTITNFLPFFAFYYFSLKGILTRKHLILFFLALLPVLIMGFRQSATDLQNFTGRENVVNNAVYSLMGLLPFVLLVRKKIFSFLGLLVLWFFIVQSAKRAAMIAGGIVALLFVIQTLYASEAKYKFKTFLGFIAFFILSIFGVRYFYEQNEFAIERMGLMSRTTGEGEARNTLIDMTFNGWLESDTYLSYLFGIGYNATRILSDGWHVSHNDWLELLSGYGLVGISMFFLLFYYLGKMALKSGFQRDKRMVFIAIVAVALIASGTSRWFWGPFVPMTAVLLPYLIVTHKEEF